MIYAMSDLHGCFDKYIKMLKKINLTEKDTLYILGDVVDRGEGGMDILLDMMTRDNIIPLRGNHDYLAYRLLKLLYQPTDKYDKEALEQLYEMWLSDGGKPTYNSFKRLTPGERKKVLSYLNTFLIYEEVEVGDRMYFLSHTVPEKELMMDFDGLKWEAFIQGEPEYDKQYYEDKFIVTGHTPTGLIDEGYVGKIYKKNNHIAIDCGAVFGKPLGCICLDTLEEFYVH